jgi:hypothetical protein
MRWLRREDGHARSKIGSVLQVVPAVAGKAVALLVGGRTLVRNRSADFVCVEEPSLGTGEANMVSPVPSFVDAYSSHCSDAVLVYLSDYNIKFSKDLMLTLNG